MNNNSIAYFALPLMDESVNLQGLIKDIETQDYPHKVLVACVNQYNHWWDDENYKHICIDNSKSLEILKNITGIKVIILDNSSKGNGWSRKKGGVGRARKVIMDTISQVALPNDIIISIDGDTRYPQGYATSVVNYFNRNRGASGLAIPYYHRLTNKVTDRLILRYEIYMRYYLINMLRIENPYAFTAVGSAMACTVEAYRKSGGLTPVAAGEDFYFLQKLSKRGVVGIWCDTMAYPSSRFSDRVMFGTGPALIKGNAGDWSSYPLYHFRFFDEVKHTFSQFYGLYDNNQTVLPMEDFLRKQFNDDNLWEPLRRNYKDINNFVRACYNKADALRILQYLRVKQSEIEDTDESILVAYLEKYHGDDVKKHNLVIPDNPDFSTSNIHFLSSVRDLLFDIETIQRKRTISKK